MKKAIIAVICVLIVGGGAVGGYFLLGNRTEAEESVSAYREYRTAKGSVKVGITESGTVALEREYVSVPVASTVSEVNVSVGSAVTKGSLLLKLDTEELEKSAESFRLSTESARLAYETAVAQRESKITQAKEEYDRTLLSQYNADTSYSTSVKQLDSDLYTAQKKLDDLKESLEEYEEMEKTYPEDYERLNALTDEKDALTEQLETVKKEQSKYKEETNDDLTEYNTLKTAYEKAQTTYDELKEASDKLTATYEKKSESSQASDSDYETYRTERDEALKKLNTASETLWTAKQKYLTMLDIGSAINQKLDYYEDKVEQLEDKLDKITDEYNDFNDYYKDTYTVEGDEISSRISSAKDDISAAELNIEKLTASYSDNVLSAEYERDKALLSADSAQSQYDSAVQAADAEILELKTKYEDMAESYEEARELVDNGGCVYSEIDGTVSAVSAAEDSDFQAGSTLVTVMNREEVTLSASVSEEDITSLTVGQAVSVVLSSYQGVTISGEVSEISAEPARSSGSISYTVTVSVYNDDIEKLTVYEGMTGDITFIGKEVSDVLYVNKQAIIFEDGKSYVLVSDGNNGAVRKSVKTGFSDGSYVEIREGLTAGETVLTESAVSSR